MPIETVLVLVLVAGGVGFWYGLECGRRHRERMARALLPFAKFGETYVRPGDGGWATPACRRPVHHWFEPSDFDAAVNALQQETLP